MCHPVSDLQDPAHADTAKDAARFGLCEHCLGRCFARVDYGYGNDERGRILADAWDLDTVPFEGCHVCEGLLGRIETMAKIVDDTLQGIEFDTFLVGTRIEASIETRQGALFEAIGAEETESIGTEINREIGKRLEQRHGWAVDLEAPDVAAILDTTFHHVDLDIAPLFLYGRYRKHAREIPQTKWPCRRCQGTGCADCQASGRTYILSVEALISAPAIPHARAEDATFHGAGREDVDALMIGTGRPFVLELTNPKRRTFDPEQLEAEINKTAEPAVDIEGLHFVDKEAVPLVKNHRGSKTYGATVQLETPTPTETLKKVCRILEGAEVAQRTPSRVSHRRADKVRHRNVTRCRLREDRPDERQARLLIQGDAGLYVKELISGDDGRTEPSLASLIGHPATCTALDVVRVEGPESLDEQAPGTE